MSKTLTLNSAPAPDADSVRRLSRQFDQVGEMMARLSGSNISSSEFFQTMVTRTIGAIDGPAGAIWLKSPQGLLQLHHQTNMGQIGLDDRRNGRAAHGEMLKIAFGIKKLIFVEPEKMIPAPEGVEAGNLTTYPVVLAPILTDQADILGIFEIWLDANANLALRNAQVQFVLNMSGYASNFLKNTAALRNSAQEQVFTQLEAFSRQIHSSLNPTEVAFQVANEGRRLIGCDRISVGVRHGRRTKIEAVSGSDIVEKASVQVKMMRDLFDAVLDWNQTLVYRGSRDSTLPAEVLAALDAYLSQSNPKLLVLQPLRDEREAIKEKEKEPKPGPSRSALLLESFDPPEQVDPLLQRFEIVCGHSASALYNASEMKRIPLPYLWKPMLALQKRAGGKARFYTFLGLSLVTILVLMLVFVPYPLKLDAKGQLLPEERNYIYAAGQGRVMQFKVDQGQIIRPNTPIAVVMDLDLAKEIQDKIAEKNNSEAKCASLNGQSNDTNMPEAKRKEKRDELAREQNNLATIEKQLQLLLDQHKANLDNPGEFVVMAPEFRRARNARGPASWKVVSADFKDQLTNRFVKPTDPLLRIGNTAGAWQIEMKIPQKHVSQLLRAYSTMDPNEYLEVDVLAVSEPTSTYKGRLYRARHFGRGGPEQGRPQRVGAGRLRLCPRQRSRHAAGRPHSGKDPGHGRRGPHQDSLRQPFDGLLPVPRYLGVPLRTRRICILNDPRMKHGLC